MRKALVATITAALMALGISAQTGEVVIKNATILTASRGTLENTDILIRNGKIARIARNISAGSGARVIDATGKYVTPGIIDAHSHTMMNAVNESSLSVTSMTRIRDVLNPRDVAIYRGLAGGVTAALLLHGSANAIGGQSSTVKFKYGRDVEDFLVEESPGGDQVRHGREPQAFEPGLHRRPDPALSADPNGRSRNDAGRIRPCTRL
jgi:imidazolonepropionase-like amidohydrolase